MTEDFLSKGLQEDRYLKAIQLINHFESELRAELERIGDQIVADNRELFVDGASADWNNRRSSGSVIAFARVDYVMDRYQSAASDAPNLKLNLSFRWVDPADLGHPDVSGALTLLSYKIKQLRDEDYEEMRAQSLEKEWDVQFADDAFSNAPGIVYVPVSDTEELHQAQETLYEHFSQYGERYGVADASN